MAPTARPSLGRRLRLAAAGAAVLTAVAAATAAAATPTSMGMQADAGPRSLTSGFLLHRGRYITLEVPGATVETGPGDINNRGQITGTYDNPNAAPSPSPATTPPMVRMA